MPTTALIKRLRWVAVALVAVDLGTLAAGLASAQAAAWLAPARYVSAAITVVLVAAIWRLGSALQQAQTQADAALQRQRQIVEALPAAVMLFDTDDRLVLCNAEFRRRYAGVADLLQPGTSFETLLRAGVERGLTPAPRGAEQAWIAERLAAHRQLHAPMQRQQPDGRWLRVVELRLPDGSLLMHGVDVTELVLNEQALQAAHAEAELARQRLQDAIEALPATFELYDADDRLVMHNTLLARTYPAMAPHLQRGAHFEALARLNFTLGGLPLQVADADTWVALRQAQRRAPAPGSSVLLPLADGRSLRMYETRLRDGSVVAIRVDVTELEAQRRAFDAARHAAEVATQRLEDAIEALPAGFELYDADDRLVLSNSVMRTMYPRVADLLDQRPCFEQLVLENHRRGGLPQLANDDALRSWLAARQAQRRDPGAPRVHQLAEGRWIRSYERRTRDGGLVGVRIDVTEIELQKAQAEAARAAAESASTQLHAAIEALPDAFVLFDADDRIVVFNRRYLEMYAESAPALRPGTRFEDVLRHGLAHGQYPQAAGREADWLAERIAAHRQPAGPALQELPGNRWVRIDERRTPSGGVAGVRTDVSELVRREQELTRLNARLDTLNAELAQLSETDALTGLPNRRQFDRRLAEECARASRHGMPLALLLVDVDHFKRYNDRHGHPAGDVCLRRIADALRTTARRPNDLVARWGGEEFAMLLPHHDAADALAQAERSVAAVDTAALPHGDSPVAPQVTISVGVASVGDATGRDAGALVAAADAALYRAKQAGRHRVAA